MVEYFGAPADDTKFVANAVGWVRFIPTDAKCRPRDRRSWATRSP